MILLFARDAKTSQSTAVSGRTRLVKMVFLFKEEVSINKILKGAVSQHDLPVFVPYKYGPFSAEVYSDLDFLINLNLIKNEDDLRDQALLEESAEFQLWQEEGLISSEDYEEEYRAETFSLTSNGINFCQQNYEKQLAAEQWAIIAEFKSRCIATSLKGLLEYVYSKYPPYTTNSEIMARILGQSHE